MNEVNVRIKDLCCPEGTAQQGGRRVGADPHDAVQYSRKGNSVAAALSHLERERAMGDGEDEGTAPLKPLNPGTFRPCKALSDAPITVRWRV